MRIKQFTTDQGVFNEYNLRDFESQYKVICNFFNVLRSFYEKEGMWLKSGNPFMANSGCYAGIDFLCKDLYTKCAERKSFEQTTIRSLIPLEQNGSYI